MASKAGSKSAGIRERLGYPVIDSDGHVFESDVIFFDYLKSEGGTKVVDGFRKAAEGTFADPAWSTHSMAERRDLRYLRPTWYSIPSRNTRDTATVMFPRLMYERLEEMGLDFSVVYPTMGFLVLEIWDDEVRRAAARAMNRMKADMFRGLGDRLAPVAVIPMHTPDEAIAELEYSVRELGIKAVMLASYVRRPIPHVARKYPGVERHAYWMDTFGLDSEYDYDPVWAKCQELKVSPTFHSLGYGWGTRCSISNYVHNHIGNFAASAEAVCKGLFLGGVPKRFPKLTFAFLEGGIPWARSLYCDLVAHWHKRNREAVENYNPANLNRALFTDLAARYGGRFSEGRAEKITESLTRRLRNGEDPDLLDEWAPSGVRRPEDIRDVFVKQFYFGCEGDDPLNALAFETRGVPFNARLNPLYGSDIGHWDVPDMSEVVEEAYELVEHGVITDEQLRQFLFVNSVEFWVSTNPDFFKGTAVEAEVNKFLASAA